MEAIYEAGGKLDLALTLEDHRAGQKSGRVYIDDFCGSRAIPLVKTSHINDDVALAAIKSHDIDWLFIIGWSQIANSAVLNAPRLGVLGIHPSLLPIGRGRAAIPWAILKRLDETGVTLFKLAEGVDTGPILAQVRIPLATNTDAAWLYAAVNSAHITLIREVLPSLTAENIRPIPQNDSAATIWPGRKPDDGRIDLTGSVEDAECLVRAVTRPYPGAFIDLQSSRMVIWKARIGKTSTQLPTLSFPNGVLECLEYDMVDLPAVTRSSAS